MTQNIDVQGLQSKAEARLASLKDEKLVTRIAVLSTFLGQGKVTERLMIGTHQLWLGLCHGGDANEKDS